MPPKHAKPFKRARPPKRPRLKALPRLLVTTRARHGMTQENVIDRLGCKATTYKSWEKGQCPHAEWYVAIGKLCGIPLDEVIDLVTEGRS